MLDDHVRLGDVYRVDPYSKQPGRVLCGGCKTIFDVSLVFVEARGSSTGGLMPIELFEELN